MTTATPSQSSPSYEAIKLGIDAHAKYYWVSRQVDGATPQPVQKITYDELLPFVVKQQKLTNKVVTCYEAGAFEFHPYRRFETRGSQAAIVETQRRLPGKEDIWPNPAPRKPFTRNKSSNRSLKLTNFCRNFQSKLDQPHSRKSLFAPFVQLARGIVAGRAKGTLRCPISRRGVAPLFSRSSFSGAHSLAGATEGEVICNRFRLASAKALPIRANVFAHPR
jgi:hypothetical protein